MSDTLSIVLYEIVTFLFICYTEIFFNKQVNERLFMTSFVLSLYSFIVLTVVARKF